MQTEFAESSTREDFFMRTGQLICAISEQCADLLYACEFYAPDPVLYFAAGNEKGLAVSILEYNRAARETKPGVKVYDRNDFFDKDDLNRKTSDLIVKLTEKFKIDCWQVPYDFRFGLARELNRAGVQISPVKGEFYPERRTKSEMEVDKIRKAQRVAESAMRRAEEILGEASIGNDGVIMWQGDALTSEILRAELSIVILRQDMNSKGLIAAGGGESSEPHNFGTGPLIANSPIVIDIFPRDTITGYWGDMTRTYVKGKADKRVKCAYAAVHDAKEAAKEKIMNGVIASEIHQLAFDRMDGHGFPTGHKQGKHYGFIHGLGHGVGLDIHEAPRLSPLNPSPLETGDVVTVEPGLYYPEWGGIRLEDVVVVREDGCECLTEMPEELEIS